MYNPEIAHQIIDSYTIKRNSGLNSSAQMISSLPNLLDQSSKNFQFNSFLDQYQKNKIEIEAANKKYSASLNFFHFFHIDELKHSELLAFLLKPYESHGQGKLFLNIFLKLLSIESEPNENWQISVELDNIDVMLKRVYPESIVIIENKSNNAQDQLNQVYRYWYNQIYRSKPGLNYEDSQQTKNYKILYITPNKEKVIDDNSLTKPDYLKDTSLPEKVPMQISYWTFDEHIYTFVIRCISAVKEQNPQNIRLLEYLKQYAELISKL